MLSGDVYDPRAAYVSEVGGFTVLLQEEAGPVLGQGSPTDKVAAVKIGCSPVTPQAYANTQANIEAAIHHRIKAKQVKPKLTEEDKARIKAFVYAAKDDKRGIFSRSNIERWARENPIWEELKSSKWSADRVRAAVDKAWAKAEIRPDFAIKLEALPERGKAPRLLIADSDLGQLLALACIGCFETLLFERYKDHAIKHEAPRDALVRVLTRMRGGAKYKQQVIEGDGSSWDTCCGVELRALLEAPLLWHVSAVLIETMGQPKEWFVEHMRICDQKKLKSKNKKVDPVLNYCAKEVMNVIDAIRRSGHRGTSCLNWWVNHSLWALSFMDDARRVLNPNARRFKCRYGGQDVFYDYLFEGDDSYVTSQNLVQHEEQLKAFWLRHGFVMKFVLPKPWTSEDVMAGVSTVVGFNVLVDEHGPLPDEVLPEPMRGLVSSAWSTSVELRNGLDKGCPRYHGVAAASYLARYAGTAGCFPALAAMYRAQATYHLRHCDKAATLDRESQMKLFGREAPVPMQEVLSAADELRYTRREASRLIQALGLRQDNVERALCEAVEELGPDADQRFRLLLPRSWRAKLA